MGVSPEDNLVLCVTGCLTKQAEQDMTKVGHVFVCASCLADKTICFSECCDDEDCPCSKLCDDGRYCERHFAEKDAEMAAHFGIRPGDPEGNRRRLDAMRPKSTLSDDEWMERRQDLRDAGRGYPWGEEF